MELKTLVKVLVPIVVIVLVVRSSTRNRADASSAVRLHMTALLQEMDDYRAHENFITSWAEVVHLQAFQEAYDMGGRSRSATLDRPKYIDAYLDRMTRLASNWKKKRLADALRKLHAEIRANPSPTGDE